MKTIPVLLLSALLVGAPAPAQDETPAVPAAPQDAAKDGWSEGFGRAPSFRSALAMALEDAVARSKGVAIARGPSLRSRLAVVTESQEGEQENWFDGQSEAEQEWVQQQLEGFVRSYRVEKKAKGDDGIWEVTVRAHVLGLDDLASELVVELVDNDLREWQLERFEEGGAGRPFDRRKGRFEGPKIGDYLRKSGAVKIVSEGPGVQVGAGSARGEREKAGHELVASHRIVVDWKPLVVQSLVEKPNRARPTSGPRPEYMQAGVVQVALRIDDLIERTVVLDENFAVPADKPGSYSSDRLDAFVTALVDKAKAEVAKKIFFALRPPVVVKKWAGDGGAWFVEARMSRRIAAGFREFVVGNDGSLADPDWQPLATARLVGGSAQSCTFQLVDVADPAGIQPDVSEVRPVR